MNEEKDYKNKIEAILFASGRFMSADTLLSLTGASNKNVLSNNILRLREEYDQRNSPLMIIEEADGWKVTVREKYLPIVRNIVSEMELPKTILETLAVIAWKSPVLQSEVVDIRHNKAYEHVSELEELGFIKKEPTGRSYLIKLTEKFYEYFDVEGTKDIREVFNKVVGRPSQTKVEDFENLPEWYKQGAKFLEPEKDENENLPEWYKQGKKFLEDEPPNQEDEEFSEL